MRRNYSMNLQTNQIPRSATVVIVAADAVAAADGDDADDEIVDDIVVAGTAAAAAVIYVAGDDDDAKKMNVDGGFVDLLTIRYYCYHYCCFDDVLRVVDLNAGVLIDVYDA